ncbi:MAG TPA: sugar ABC transporter ATP-binding protein [Symbiobacteriaceae bacterium]|nr:sugar ABC transporter ATP-binding protein [Symbiobacteriaceae bacterium]
MAGPALEMRRISKRFPGVVALEEVDLKVYPGEVLGLVGENGAGKSTLMKILAGAYPRDSGQILIQGSEVEIGSTRRARELGISIIYQELALFPDLDAVENVFLAREEKGHFGLLNRAEMERRVGELLELFGLAIPFDTPVRRLTMAQRQIIEIIRALSRDASIIVMDEPTAALEEVDREHLYQAVKTLRQRGVAVIYVSHQLEELLHICDRVTVLRDGHKVADMPVSQVDVTQLIQLMVGRTIRQQYPKEPLPLGATVLTVRGATNRRFFTGVDLALRRGEVVGLAGLSGSGKSEFARALVGLIPLESGEVRVQERPVDLSSPRAAVQSGIAFLPADRKGEGLFLDHTVGSNMNIAVLHRLGRLLISARRESALADQYIRELGIRTPSGGQIVQNLSGGNQQKVMLARWLATEPQILVLEEPTRGIDVNAKVEVYRLIVEFARNGGAVLLVSSESSELLGMCDRILVMFEGGAAAHLTAKEASDEKLAAYSLGSGVRA